MIGPGYGFGAIGCGSVAIFIGILLIGLFFYFISKNKKKPIEPIRINSGQDAMELLKVRLARGEITPEEYQAIKDTITK